MTSVALKGRSIDFLEPNGLPTFLSIKGLTTPGIILSNTITS